MLSKKWLFTLLPLLIILNINAANKEEYLLEFEPIPYATFFTTTFQDFVKENKKEDIFNNINFDLMYVYTPLIHGKQTHLENIFLFNINPAIDDPLIIHLAPDNFDVFEMTDSTENKLLHKAGILLKEKIITKEGIKMAGISLQEIKKVKKLIK